MQRVITIRASHSDLDGALQSFTQKRWKVMSVTKGSEWGRVGTSYKWTIILDIPDNYSNIRNIDAELDEIESNLSKRSYAKTALLVVGLVVGIFAVIGIACWILL